jgi:hypothetical protein
MERNNIEFLPKLSRRAVALAAEELRLVGARRRDG